MQGNLCLSNRVSPSARAHLGTRIDPAKRRIIQKSGSTSNPGADQAIAKAPGIGLGPRAATSAPWRCDETARRSPRRSKSASPKRPPEPDGRRSGQTRRSLSANNLLSEHEITKLIAPVSSIADRMGVKPEVDLEVDELKQDVAPEAVLDEIEERKR